MPRTEHCNRRIDTYARYVVRCTRFGRAGPARRIRRAPWRWSIHPLVEWTAPGDVCLRPLRRGRTQDGWLRERCQTPVFPIEEPTRTATDPFGSRELPSPIHEARFAARTPGTLCHTLFPCWTERVLRGTCRSVIRRHLCPRSIDPKVLDSFLSSTLHASTKPLLIHPRSTRTCALAGTVRIDSPPPAFLPKKAICERLVWLREETPCRRDPMRLP